MYKGVSALNVLVFALILLSSLLTTIGSIPEYIFPSSPLIPITVALSLSSAKYNGDSTPNVAIFAEMTFTLLLTTIGSQPSYRRALAPPSCSGLVKISLLNSSVPYGSVTTTV